MKDILRCFFPIKKCPDGVKRKNKYFSVGQLWKFQGGFCSFRGCGKVKTFHGNTETLKNFLLRLIFYVKIAGTKKSRSGKAESFQNAWHVQKSDRNLLAFLI